MGLFLMKNLLLRCWGWLSLLNWIGARLLKQNIRLREADGTVLNQRKRNLSFPIVNQVSCGDKSLRYYGPKIWNSILFHIKTSENLKTFKGIIKNWNGSTCNCWVCQIRPELI